MPGIAALLKRHAAEVDELTGAHADEFLSLLQQLKDTLTGRLAASGDMANPLDVWRVRYVLGETEAGIAKLESRASGLYSAATKDAVDLSVDHIGAELDRMSTAFGGAPMDISISAAKALADPVQGLLANHFETSIERYGGELLNGVRQRLFVGLRAGDSFGEIVKDVSAETGPFGAVGKSNAERLVRTELSQSYGQAHAASFKQAKAEIPDLAETWIHLGSYPCPTCNPLHGTKRPGVGYWTIAQGKRTRKVVHPPAHPRCTCRLIATRPSWTKKLESAGYLEKQADDDQPSL